MAKKNKEKPIKAIFFDALGTLFYLTKTVGYHYALAELYPEVHGVLNQLQPSFQLAVVSNFDGRLRLILQHLGISKFFAHIFISSEIGADKPDPEIFRRALKLIDLKPNEVLHVGDDSERDWEAASAAGLSIFRLDRPNNSLRDLVTTLTTNGLE